MKKVDIDNNIIDDFRKEKSVNHIFTSAKTGEGLEEVFYIVCKNIANKMNLEIKKKHSVKKGIKLQIDENKDDKKDSCC